MAKVFTITEGLENLGAIKSGGQGSVYKAKRVGEIITAVKLLPTPIISEDLQDKNFRDFTNEVEKLKKVNEHPNPHVVTVISSGITETGCFPFIEMEYIDGPDMGELLKPPHEKLFTIQETIKVAMHISDALAHCHNCDVKHGDIKSNNVKLNLRTGNYMLLDFGLAAMSDEDRRTSLRHAGAIEFMAPEQNHGNVFFETDIYSFGVIIFELLAGSVPFPLQDSGETSRNAVMISHMETPPPDLLALRSNNMPDSWSEEKRNIELQVPHWLIDLVYKCLEKKPEDRFHTGAELKEYIALNSTVAIVQQEMVPAASGALEESIERLVQEKEQLQQMVLKYQQAAEANEDKIQQLRQVILQHEHDGRPIAPAMAANSIQQKSTPVAMYILVALVVLLSGGLVYSIFSQSQVHYAATESISDSLPTEPANIDSRANYDVKPQQPDSQKNDSRDLENTKKELSIAEEDSSVQTSQRETAPKTSQKTDTDTETKADTSSASNQQSSGILRYKVKSKAYFHNEPNESTQRNAFIVHWNNATLTPIDEQDGFVYIVFTNHLGQTSKGWLKKSDLVLVH